MDGDVPRADESPKLENKTGPRSPLFCLRRENILSSLSADQFADGETKSGRFRFDSSFGCSSWLLNVELGCSPSGDESRSLILISREKILSSLSTDRFEDGETTGRFHGTGRGAVFCWFFESLLVSDFIRFTFCLIFPSISSTSLRFC